MSTHHNGEEDLEIEMSLKDTEKQEENDLDGCVQVDPSIGNMSEIFIVWFVFVTNEEEFESLDELYSIERGHAQVQH